jgi:hypothetical protein
MALSRLKHGSNRDDYEPVFIGLLTHQKLPNPLLLRDEHLKLFRRKRNSFLCVPRIVLAFDKVPNIEPANIVILDDLDAQFACISIAEWLQPFDYRSEFPLGPLILSLIVPLVLH